jgi:hypothetical protein
VVFLPGPVRVSDLLVSVGERVSDTSSVLEVSGEEQQVEFAAVAADLDVIEVGGAVTVQLPDRRTLDATVTLVTPADEILRDSGFTHRVTASIVDPETVAGTVLGGSSVDVLATRPITEAGLVVPVEAIFRTDVAGHTVEILGIDGSTEFVEVEVLGKSGRDVAIAGEGLAEGVIVISP